MDVDGQFIPFDSGTWEWNGMKWEAPSFSIDPPHRSDAAMAYDDTRGVCVLFGGHFDSLSFNDTYEWDGSRWTFRQAFDPTATNRPPPMKYPVMTYDSARQRSVLVGEESNRTWEWNGTNWSAHVTNPRPPLSSDKEMRMAYDSSRHVTLLFVLNETWTWDGTTWRQVATSGPPSRSKAAMAFDVRRKVMILFGGQGGGGTGDQLDDTWEWNGQSWSSQPDAARLGLGPREGSTMWYDTVEQRMVLFGGGRWLPVGGGLYKGSFPNDVWEARPPGYWVDFNALGQPSFPETGYFNEPFNTLGEAVSSANPGCTLNLKTGSRAEMLTISKSLMLDAYGGPATIGHQ